MDEFDVIVVGAGSAGAVLASAAVGGSRHFGAAARGRARPHVGGRARGPAFAQLLRRADGAGPHLAGPRRDSARPSSPRRSTCAASARAVRRRSTRWARSAAPSTTTSAGPASSGAPAGAGPRCSRRSCASRTTSTTAATVCTARAARSRSGAFPLDELAAARRARCAPRSTDLGYPDLRRLPRARTPPASAGGRSRCATAGASRRTTRTSSRRAPRPNLEVRGDALVDRVAARRPARGRRARSPTATEIARARGDRRARARSTRPRSCCARASASTTACRSARTSRTTPRRRASRSRSTEAAACRRRDAPVFSSLLRYTSGLADAGPNDMQIIWFNAVGADRRRRSPAAGSSARSCACSRTARFGCAPPTRASTRSSSSACSPTNATASGCATAVRRMIEHRAPPGGRVDQRPACSRSRRPIDELDSDAAIDAWLARQRRPTTCTRSGRAGWVARTIRPRWSTPTAG